MTSNVLPLFWNLASSSKETRLEASADLVSNLEGFQREFQVGRGNDVASDDEEDVEMGDNDEEEDEDDDEDAESGIEVDGSDDGDESGDLDEDAAALDASLTRDNAEDVSYTVKRLVRGLASSRESSRLGFAVALTELLSRIHSVTASQVFSLILRNSQTNKGMKGTDERDGLFARLFGLIALVQSGCLFSSQKGKAAKEATEVVGNVLACLVELGGKKGWLRESAWWGVGQALEGAISMPEGEGRKAILEKLYDVIREEKVFTQEKLALVLTLEKAGLTSVAKSLAGPTFKHSPVLSSQNLVSLARVLKGSDVADDEDGTIASTGSWKPQLHFVWTTILDSLLSSASTSQTSFAEFFRVVVDESLFANTSSPQRRYWGFQIFISSLPLVSPDQIPQLFTPNFMRCWINNLSSTDRYLNKAAQQTAKVVQEVVKAHPKVGVALLSRLVGKNGRMDFDKATKTKTVEGILGSLDSKGVMEYVVYLQAIVVGGQDADINGLDDRRRWAIDQMVALCRNASVPKDDEWVTSVVDFLAVHGFYTIRKASKKSNVSAAQTAPKPPLPEATTKICRDRFYSAIVELTTTPPTRSSPDTPSTRQQGCDASGKLWLLRAIEVFATLSADAKHLQPILEVDEEILKVRQTGLDTLAKLKNVKKISEEVVRGVEILLAYTVLQTYDEKEDMLEMLEDVNTAAERMFGLATSEASTSTATDPEPIDMLLDTLIALLDKGSSDLKNLASMVVGLVAPAFTRSSIEHLVAQLEAAPTVEGGAMEGNGVDADDEVMSEAEDDEADEGEDEEDDEQEEGDGESSEGEVEEDDEDLPAVDPAFRRKVAAALKSAGVGIDEGENGEEEEEDDDEVDEDVWDDDQMDKVDEQLAAVFKERATTEKKTSSKRLLMESLHFKTRILDLFDTFIRKQYQNPLSLDTLLPLLRLTRNTTPTEADLANKASALIRSRIGKSKDVPSTVDITHATTLLTEIHETARKASSADYSSLCSSCSIFITRSIEATDPTSTAGTDAYRSTLDEFMSRKSSLVHPSFLLDYIRRFPLIAWPLHTDLIKYIAPGKGVNAFRQTQAYAMLTVFSQHLAAISKSDSVPISQIRSFISSARQEVYATFQAAANGDATSEWKADRLKEVAKFALNLARSTKSVLPEEVENLWESKSLVKVEEELKNGQKTKEMRGVLGLIVQLKAVLAGQAGADAKAKAKAEKKDNKAKKGPEEVVPNGTATKVKGAKKRRSDVAEEPVSGEKKEKKEKKAKKVKVAEE